MNMTANEIKEYIKLPNFDVNFNDCEVMMTKPKMPAAQKNSIKKNALGEQQSSGAPILTNHRIQQATEDKLTSPDK